MRTLRYSVATLLTNPASSSIKDEYLCVFVFIFYLNLPKSENKEFLMRYFFRLAFLL